MKLLNMIVAAVLFQGGIIASITLTNINLSDNITEYLLISVVSVFNFTWAFSILTKKESEELEMKDNKEFKSITEGLSESLEYAKGNTTKARRMSVTIDNALTIDSWHYPSKGEYPSEGEEILFRSNGQNYLGTYSKISNYFDSHDMGSPASYVDCWQYIKPPIRRKND